MYIYSSTAYSQRIPVNIFAIEMKGRTFERKLFAHTREKKARQKHSSITLTIKWTCNFMMTH